jgi:transglutaminase-like putative cysteine protease
MKELVKSVAFPSLLGFVVLLSMLNVYDGVNIFSATGVFAVNLALFCLYEKLRLYNKNWFSTVIVLLIYVLVGIVAVTLIRIAGRSNLVNIVDWFFKGGDEELYIPLFTGALLTFFTPFISMTVFYFTNVRYRPFYLTLTCIITFAIYAKSLTPIPFIYPALIIAAFLFVAVERKWAGEIDYKRFVITGACFVATSAYVAALFPQAENTPYREDFDSFISQGRFADPLGFVNIMDSSRSGRNNPNANLEQVLFRIHFVTDGETETPHVVRRQVFCTFNGDFWEYTPSLPVAGLNHTDFSLEDNWATFLVSSNVFANILPTVPWTYAILQPYNTDISKNIRGEFITETPLRQNSYSVNFSSTASVPFFDSAYLDSQLELPNYFGRRDVRALALALTEGLDCDFEKAQALERYFYSECEEFGRFYYDIRVSPPTKCVYTFLFETRRGTCSDFASAMTVLARETGLPARYVEGFIISEDDGFGGFIVRAEHSHAFPEVFVYGQWHIFEPTIAGSGGGDGGFGYDSLLIVLLSIGTAGAGGLLFVVFALPHIRERAFRSRVRKSPREIGVRLVYNRIHAVVSETFAPGESLSSRDVSALVCSEYGVSMNELTENYDKVVYGESDCDYNSYSDYESFRTAVRNYEEQNKRRKRSLRQSRTRLNAEQA